MPDTTTASPVYDLEGARKAGVPEDAILGAFRSKYGDIYDYDKAQKAGLPSSIINDTIAKKINDPEFQKQQFRQSLVDTKDRFIDQVKPIADAGATILGSMTPAGVAGGLVAGAGTDALLQRLQSSKAMKMNQTQMSKDENAQPGSLKDTALNAVQNETVNELLGKVFGYVGGKVKSLFTPVDPELAKLGPTMSQYAEKPGTVSSMLENIWGHSAKQDAMTKSAGLARDEFGKVLGDVQPNPPVNPADRFNIGKLNDSFVNSKNAVEDMGNNTTATIKKVYPPNEGMGNAPRIIPTTIKAPVSLQNTEKAAQDFLNERQQFYGNDPNFSTANDSDKKLIAQAQQIVNISKENSGLIPFRDAMDFLHGPNGDGGLEAMSHLEPGEINSVKNTQGQFADALNKDIQTSVSKYANSKNGTTALDSYNTARSSAIQKRVLAEGGNVQRLVENVNGPIPQIDKALQNETRTQKLLNTSNLAGLQSSNMRQDLAGYRLQQIWNKADSGSGTLNGQALLKEWNNPDFEASKSLLYGSGPNSTASRIDQFFNNVAKVSNVGTGGGANTYGMVRLGYEGINIAGNVIHGILSGNALSALGHTAGFAALEIPPMFVGRMLSKPIVAQVLQRAITKQPLEMSTQQAGRLIMGALNGATVNLINSQGDRTPAKVVNGQVQ